jgi:GTP-binding protein
MPETLAGRMRQQTEIAIREADLIFFMIDAKTGLMPDDKHLRRDRAQVRQAGRAGRQQIRGARRRTPVCWKAGKLGLGEPVPVSAEHGQGLPDLRDAVVEALGEERVGPPEDDDELAEPLIGETSSKARPMKSRLTTTPNRCASPWSAARMPASRR